MGPPITTPGGTGDRDDSDKPEQWPEFALTRINITSGCHNGKTLSETYKDNTIIPSIGPSYKTHRETARLTERVSMGLARKKKTSANRAIASGALSTKLQQPRHYVVHGQGGRFAGGAR